MVGHVEWVEFARVPHVPAAGEIVHAERAFEEPAGGGGVVARQLTLLAGRCELFTALGRSFSNCTSSAFELQAYDVVSDMASDRNRDCEQADE